MTTSVLSLISNALAVLALLAPIAIWLAVYPIVRPIWLGLTGNMPDLSTKERSYLSSLSKDLEHRNERNRWTDRFYIPIDTELQDRHLAYDVPPAFYLVKSIHRHRRDQDFNNLSNVEKIDSSRGRTFKSLEAALNEAQDNAVIVIGPPGSGKTVSLRNLAIKQAKARLLRRTSLLPIFVNLGNYTGFNSDGTIQLFARFLEEFFASNGYCSYLANGRWETLLRSSRCVFFLDGVDELPRSPREYESRSQQVAAFVNLWPGTQFILSCRELDYNRELSFQEILIKPFDRRHIRTYLRRYFAGLDHRVITRQLEHSAGVYDLCRNPFYLDLICYVIKSTKTIPSNKAEIFTVIVDKFLERERTKQAVSVSGGEFVSAMSHLAYYLAVERMATTVRLGEYSGTITSERQRTVLFRMIDYAIKGELLEFNQKSDNVRFIHNRFQEFFSSHYVLKRYREDISVLPGNAFTNIWWRETVLFVAGLEEDPGYLVEMISRGRSQVTVHSVLVRRLLKLEMTILGFECIRGSSARNDEALYRSVRTQLIDDYAVGDTLVKAKVLEAVGRDRSPEVLALLRHAVKDDSLWVSERAFFMLCDERLKMQMTPRGILGEFGRFFMEGRLLSTIVPVVRGARTSRLMALFMPVYLVLVLASLASFAIVGLVFYSFLTFVAFKLQLAFTYECLSCLLAVTSGSFIIVYCLMSNSYPVAKRFIYCSPLAVMVQYVVLYTPSGLPVRVIGVISGVALCLLYYEFQRKPNEKMWSLGTFTVLFSGMALVAALWAVVGLGQLGIAGIGLPPTVGSSLGVVAPYIAFGAFSVALMALVLYVYRQATVVSRLNGCIAAVDGVLTRTNSETGLVRIFDGMFESLSLLWAQKVLLKTVVERMTSDRSTSRERKMSFLGSLAMSVSNAAMRDAVYQQLEEEENNYRRTIQAGDETAGQVVNTRTIVADGSKVENETSEADADEEFHRWAIEADPRNAGNLGTYGVFMDRVRHDPDRAEAYYRRAIEADPRNAANLGNYAVFLNDVRHDLDGAEAHYKLAIKANPKHANNLRNYAVFLQNDRHDLDGAEAHYKRAIKANPKDANNLRNYAVFLRNDRHDLDGAEAHYKRAIEADPADARNLGNFAVFLRNDRHDLDGAEAHYKRAIEADPADAVNLGNYAAFLYNVRHDHDGTEAFCKRAIEADSTNATNLGRYAFFLSNIRHDTDAAQAYYLRAIEANPGDAQNLGSYADFLSTIRHDADAAEAYYLRAIEANPNHADNLSSYAIFLHTVRDDPEAAEAYYKRAVEVDPTNANALANHAGLLLADGNTEDGLRLLAQLSKGKTGDGSLLHVAPVLFLESAFYSYAHDPDHAHRIAGLATARKLLKAGLRSPGWSLDRNVERARHEGHPEPDFLRILASVIVGGCDIAELEQFECWTGD